MTLPLESFALNANVKAVPAKAPASKEAVPTPCDELFWADHIYVLNEPLSLLVVCSVTESQLPEVTPLPLENVPVPDWDAVQFNCTSTLSGSVPV